METITVHSHTELMTILADLGEPPDGRIRVFRGQTREFKNSKGQPSLLPTLSRRSGAPMYDPAWMGTMVKYISLDDSASTVSPDLETANAWVPVSVDFETSRVWAPALVQHYGPGSHFLDVTHDIDVALWFSCHQYHERWITLEKENDPQKIQNNIRHAVAWSTEIVTGGARTDASSPIIYVFDVVPWNGVAIPEHGQLVDLLALGPMPQLLKKANRLKAQSAALIYADQRSPERLDLYGEVLFRVLLGHDFDISQIADRKWVEEIFPPITTDPLYKTLVQFPAYAQFDPIRLEQPLPIALQLSRELPFRDSPNVTDLGGTGDYASPKRLKLSSTSRPGPDAYVVRQLSDYLSLGCHMKPPLCYQWILESEKDLGRVKLGSRQFHLEDALPLFLEAPLWTFTPGVESPRDLGWWIQSALPLGIADEISGHSTDNVYVEICPLDVVNPDLLKNQDLLRASWLVRVGHNYAATVFMQDVTGGVYSLTVRYRYDSELGSFEKEEPTDMALDAGNLVSFTLKALFVTLTIVRDLSPGFKPPSRYSLIADDMYLPGTLLVPQLAKPHLTSSTGYVIPKALDGTRYLKASGGPREPRFTPENRVQALDELERFFPLVKAPHYRAFAGLELAGLNVSVGRLDRAREVLEIALETSRKNKLDVAVQKLEEHKLKILMMLARVQVE